MEILATYFRLMEEGIVTHHHDINFAAIGIGSGHAKSYLMFSKYQKLTPYFRAFPILYRAKKQAEVAPGVGAFGLSRATGSPNSDGAAL